MAPIKTQTNSTKRQQTEAPKERDKTRDKRPKDKEGQKSNARTVKPEQPEQEEGGRAVGAEPNTDTGTPTPRKETRSREADRTGGERAHKDQKGCLSVLVDVQRGTWNIKDEYLSAAAQSNAKTFQSGVEGRNTPHRAEPLVPL